MTGRGAKPDQRKRRSRKAQIGVKRVYDKPAPEDGVRILIDRLWPRGLSKAALKFDLWTRELAPSNELRKWYGHQPDRFAEFRRRYRDEIAPHRDALAALRKTIEGRTATFITATRDLALSHATVLRELLEGKRSAQ
jgi:uncharacterized protein YeaO (DUF488 family)